ncbi:MAG TPA: DUF3397 family protein [Alloiococcus sp.]|nr:DUF3397 family protein [Alloiococcus sp.]
MGTFLYFIALVVLFIVPFVIIYFHKKINDQLRIQNAPFKTPDLLNIYLIFGIHWFSRIAFNRTWIVFLSFIMAVIGIVMVINYLRKNKDIIYSRFFRIWWRVVFLVAFVMYVVAGLAAIVSVLI